MSETKERSEKYVSLRSWRYVSSLLPFFGTRLRRQNFNLAPTQYRQLRRLKIRLKNTIETEKEKIKERKQWQFYSLKAVEKLVLPNPFSPDQ